MILPFIGCGFNILNRVLWKLNNKREENWFFFFCIMVSISFCLRSLPLWAVLLFVCVCVFSVTIQFTKEAQLVKNPPAIQETLSIPGSGRISGEGLGYSIQYSWASLVVQAVKSLPAMWETWVRSLGWVDPQEEGMATHSSILAWRIPMDREAWQATSPWGCKESDTTEWLST